MVDSLDDLTNLQEWAAVTDNQIAAANAFGMDSYDDGNAPADNPLVQPELRRAWRDGWQSGYDRAAAVTAAAKTSSFST